MTEDTHELAAALLTGNKQQREEAARSLGQMGSAAIPGLVQGLCHKSNRVRTPAYKALVGMGPGIERELVSLLGSDELRVKAAAVNAIAELRLDSESVRCSLAGCIADGRKAVRLPAISHLVKIGPEGVKALVEVYRGLLKADYGKYRILAWDIAEAMGAEGEKLLDVTLELSIDEYADIRWTAAMALGGMGAAAEPRLISMLWDSDEDVGIKAAHSLAGLGECAIPDMLRLLGHENERIAELAGIAFSSRCHVASPELLGALNHSSPRVRAYAAKAIGDTSYHMLAQKVPIQMEEAALPVSALLQDTVPQVRACAAYALRMIDSQRPEIFEIAKKNLQDPDIQVVELLQDYLSRNNQFSVDDAWIPPENMREQYINSALIESAEDSEGDVERQIKSEPRTIEESVDKYIDEFTERRPYHDIPGSVRLLPIDIAEEAIPVVIQRIKSSKGVKQQSAVHLLGVLIAKDVAIDLRHEGIRIIRPFLFSTSQFMRVYAMEAFYLVLGEALDLLPRVIELLQTDPNCRVRRRAAQALGLVGARARDAVPALLEALKDSDDFVRGLSAEALGKIKHDPETVLPALAAIMRSDKSIVARYNTASSIAAYGPAAILVIDELIEAMQHDREYLVKRYVAEALGNMGPAARKALPALKRRMRPVSGSRLLMDVADAITRIDPESDEAKACLPFVLECLQGDFPFSEVKIIGRLGALAREAIPRLEYIAAGNMKLNEYINEKERSGLCNDAAEAIRMIAGKV